VLLRLNDPNDWVRVETAAVLRRNVLVIPVLVDGGRLPDPTSLPEELRPLCRRHVCELTDARWSFDVGELVKGIEKIAHPPKRTKMLTWILEKSSLYLNQLKVLYLRNQSSYWKVVALSALAVLFGIWLFGFIAGQKEVTAHPPLGQNAITSAMPTDPVAGERVGRHGAIEPSG
jgi:hypothetical protein